MPAIIKTKAGWSELEGMPIPDRNQPHAALHVGRIRWLPPKGQGLLVFVRKKTAGKRG